MSQKAEALIRKISLSPDSIPVWKIAAPICHGSFGPAMRFQTPRTDSVATSNPKVAGGGGVRPG